MGGRVTHHFRKASLLVSALGTLIFSIHAMSAEVAEVWEGQPYRIRASLAVDAPGDLHTQLEEELPGFLRKRANTSIGSVWRFHAAAADSRLRHAMLAGLEQFPDADLPERENHEEKRLLMTIRATPWGYELAVREFDRYVQRWGPVIRRTVQQQASVPEQLFALVEQAVAPLARFTSSASNPSQVKLELRGADLPAAGAGDFRWLRAGDALQPFLVRMSRHGATVPGGATAVPWTYIEVANANDDSQQLEGRIRSATARPLGMRRGRVETIAIGMRNDREPSIIELRARDQPDKPLVGYEVYVQSGDEKDLRLIGKSDVVGEVRVGPGQTAVEMLYLKSDGVTLARLPVVPGAEPRVIVPLPDDEMRLRAAARLAALREDIVDIVARRTIYMARARQQISQKNFEAARELLRELDELPGGTQFQVTINRDAQLMRTDDVQVQRRIDKLFSDTRGALGKFLNPQPIAELYEELRQAELQSKATASSDDAT